VYVLLVGEGISANDLSQLARDQGIPCDVFSDVEAAFSQLVSVDGLEGTEKHERVFSVLVGDARDNEALERLSKRIVPSISTKLLRALWFDNGDLQHRFKELFKQIDADAPDVPAAVQIDLYLSFCSLVGDLWSMLHAQRFYTLEKRIKDNHWEILGIIPALNFLDAASQIGQKKVEGVSQSHQVADLVKTQSGDEYNLSVYYRARKLR
jgi:hypothetical protein